MNLIPGDSYKFIDSSTIYKFIRREDKYLIFEYVDEMLLIDCQWRLTESWVNEQITDGKFIKVTNGLSNMPKDGSCFHDYVEYKGFTDIYDYCRHCGVKK